MSHQEKTLWQTQNTVYPWHRPGGAEECSLSSGPVAYEIKPQMRQKMDGLMVGWFNIITVIKKKTWLLSVLWLF